MPHTKALCHALEEYQRNNRGRKLTEGTDPEVWRDAIEENGTIKPIPYGDHEGSTDLCIGTFEEGKEKTTGYIIDPEARKVIPNIPGDDPVVQIPYTDYACTISRD